MKFAKHLEAESISEWRQAYINYKGLKKRLQAIEKYRQANRRTIQSPINDVQQQQQLRNSLRHTINDTSTSPETTEVPNESGYAPTWRPKRYSNTAPAYFDSHRLEQRDSLSRNIVGRFNSSFFRRDTDLGDVYSPPISLEVNAFDEVLPLTNDPERCFFTMLDQDLENISRFYNEKEQEAKDKYLALKMQVDLVRQYRQQISDMKRLQATTIEQRLNPMQWFHSQQPLNAVTTSPTANVSPAILLNGERHMSYRVARSRLKAAITEFYRSLELLRSYKILNEMGFRKILKKFDKTAGWKASTTYDKKLKLYHWVKSDVLNGIIKDTEQLFVNEFTNGHRRKGMKKLRIPEQNLAYTKTTWRIGFCLGACISIFARVIQLAIDPEVQEQLPMLIYNMNIYSCIILPIVFTLGFSVNMAVWHRSHINYRFIFELNPRTCLNYHQFAEIPAFMLLLTSIIMYIDVSQCWAPTVPSHLCPLILVLILLAIIFCPFQIFYLSARQWLGVTLVRIAFSGLLPVEFRDFFVADELNSMAFSMWMGIYFFCVYSWNWNNLDIHCNVPKMWLSPLLACFPPLWRGLQCLRRYHNSKEVHHLINGLKYVTSIIATIFVGVRRISPSPAIEAIWILVSIINSAYTAIWDIKMDWGLLNTKSSHFLLRDNLVFYKWTYYVAIPMNIILRFAWAINKAGLAYNSQIITFLTAILEAFRRIVWNFFRLENEHLNNCGHYRAIKEIPLPFVLHEATHKESEIQPDERRSLDLANSSLLNDNIGSNGNNSNRNSAITPAPSVDLAGTLAKPSSLVSGGSFYGRRDFETRQDNDDSNLVSLVRQPSLVGQVLDRLRTLGTPAEKNSDNGEYNDYDDAIDDDDNDDDDDDDDDDSDD